MKRGGLSHRQEDMRLQPSRAGHDVLWGLQGFSMAQALLRTGGLWERMLERDGPNYVMQRFWILCHG